MIVDNAVYSFGFQLDNGIPILPFYDDKNDEEMLHLVYYLKCLSQFGDVREQNRKAFQLKELEGSNIHEFLDSFCSSAQNQGTQIIENGKITEADSEKENQTSMYQEDSSVKKTKRF